MAEKSYIAIDLKSFYASVECVERGVDPLNTFLVVADLSRTEKTICLAVSPALKAYGIPGRARLFEVVQKVKEANNVRISKSPVHKLTGYSHFADDLKTSSETGIDYIVAPPQMAKYMEISSKIYGIYLSYFAPEDIHVYSIDEVFIDATSYLRTYKMTAVQLAEVIVRDVLEKTGITATVGIGTNLYLSKIAMDIMAKHIVADRNGVRIAVLDEMSYRRNLWSHRPLTDFWRVGKGYATKLERYGMFTMGDVAQMSIVNEDLLYSLFGVNAELLIDHAWGWEPCTIADIKSYKPSSKSLSVGQVLKEPYNAKQARLVIQEMAEGVALDLVEKRLVTDQMVLTVGYDIENMKAGRYSGEVHADAYGRILPKSAHGTENIGKFTSSSKAIVDAVLRLYDRIIDSSLLVRRMYVVANHTNDESVAKAQSSQLDLFTDYSKVVEQDRQEEREKEIQHTIISLKHRFGKNAVIKAMNLQEGATAIERNGQIGGHRA